MDCAYGCTPPSTSTPSALGDGESDYAAAAMGDLVFGSWDAEVGYCWACQELFRRRRVLGVTDFTEDACYGYTDSNDTCYRRPAFAMAS